MQSPNPDKKIPHLEGKVTLNLHNGLFKCRIRLSNLPKIGGYRILLHKGMNIKSFKDSAGKRINYDGYYSGKAHHVGLEYQLIDDNNHKIEELPETFELEYVGAFPIYHDEFNAFDFKGFIANNGKTFRATEQSKWYPVIYDSIGDRYVDSYAYKLEIEGAHCTSIFVNGAAPKQGESNTFSSTKAVPLFLFAGDFDFLSIAGNYIINSDIPFERARLLIAEVEDIKSIYASNLGIEYTDSIYLINHEPVDQMPEGSHWGFNVYPAFGFAGIDFKDLLSEKGKLRPKYVELFGHELAHNYFLTNVMSGTLFWFWLESCADYLSFDVVEKRCGQTYLHKKLLAYIHEINDVEFPPLEEIESSSQITETYRYYLGPLLLKCFELRFGFKKTYQVLRSLLVLSEKKTLTIDEWAKVSQQEISQKEFEEFRKDYLSNGRFKEKIILEIKNYCQ